MCDFFSFVADEKSKRYYFDWEQRKQKEAIKTASGQTIDSFDSHSEICAYYDIDCDLVNKYEYNPLTKEFKVDQINIADDSDKQKQWVKRLDFKKIVEPLIIKPIVNSFTITCENVTDKHIELLKQWASVGDSVRDSAWASAWDSVRDSVRESVRDSVRDSVWDSVWASLWESVWESVRDSVRVYISSFFDIWNGNNPYQSCIDLYESGLVPSFDGTTWRLHTGKDAKIVYEGTF